MIDTATKKAIHNVAVRVQDDLYRSVKRTFAETDEKFQSLIVKLLSDYVGKPVSGRTEKVTTFPMTSAGRECTMLLSKIVQHGEPKKLAIVREFLEAIASSVRIDLDEAAEKGMRGAAEDAADRQSETVDPRRKGKRGNR